MHEVAKESFNDYQTNVEIKNLQNLKTFWIAVWNADSTLYTDIKSHSNSEICNSNPIFTPTVLEKVLFSSVNGKVMSF